MTEIKHRIDLVSLLPENAVVAEIGVAEGNFSADLLERGIGKLYSVDNWGHIPSVTGDGNFPQDFHDKNYTAAKERLTKYGERSVILKGLSVEMAKLVPDNSLDLLYLDGAHYYAGVAADLNAWYPKVKSNGIIAGHDYLNNDYQVKEAVSHFVVERNIITSVFVIPETHINDAGFYFIKT